MIIKAQVRNLGRRSGSLVKAGLVRIINHQPLTRYFSSYLRLFYVIAEALIYGYANAGRIQGGDTDHITIVHTPVDKCGDLERFFLRMVAAIGKRPNCSYVDLFLLLNDSRAHSKYVAIARLLERPINIQLLFDERQLFPLLKTTGGGWSDVGDDLAVGALGSAGHLNVPANYRNAAREYFKTIDACAFFCAVSIPEGNAGRAIFEVIRKLAEHYRDCAFVVLSDYHVFLDDDKLPRSLLLPARAGFDFPTCVGIAAEADALVGPTDVYGLTAFFCGKPVLFMPSEGFPDRSNFVTGEATLCALSVDEFKASFQRFLEKVAPAFCSTV